MIVLMFFKDDKDVQGTKDKNQRESIEEKNMK